MRIVICYTVLWKTTTEFHDCFCILKTHPSAARKTTSTFFPIPSHPMTTAIPACRSDTPASVRDCTKLDLSQCYWCRQAPTVTQFSSRAPRWNSLLPQASPGMGGTRVPPGPRWDLRGIGCRFDLYEGRTVCLHFSHKPPHPSLSSPTAKQHHQTKGAQTPLALVTSHRPWGGGVMQRLILIIQYLWASLQNKGWH